MCFSAIYFFLKCAEEIERVLIGLCLIMKLKMDNLGKFEKFQTVIVVVCYLIGKVQFKKFQSFCFASMLNLFFPHRTLSPSAVCVCLNSISALLELEIDVDCTLTQRKIVGCSVVFCIKADNIIG